MNNQRLWVAAAILMSVILAWFALTAPHTSDVYEPAISEAPAKQTPTVALRDSYKKGTHTITGSVMAPNPCTIVSATPIPITEASSTTSILLDITVTPDSGICLERPEEITFTATLAAPADLPIAATVNGAAASTTEL